MNPMAIFPHLPDFFRRLERFRASESLSYDLVHSHYWLSGRVGSWAAAKWRVPQLLMFHTLGILKNLTRDGEKEPELRIRVEKQLAQSADHILAATEREKDQLIKHYGTHPGKIGVVPCGVNLDLFRPINRKTSRLQLGFASDEFIVLYVGRFAHLKGIDRLMAAISYLDHHCGIRLVVVGGDGDESPEEHHLRDLCKELGIQDRVLFAGRIDQRDLPPYYSASDVLVLPSEYESFGLVALEALACGTPVVATPVGALPDIIQERINGHVLADGSPESIARGIEPFIAKVPSNPVRPAIIRSSVTAFDWAVVTSDILREYERAMEKPGNQCLSCASVKASAL